MNNSVVHCLLALAFCLCPVGCNSEREVASEELQKQRKVAVNRVVGDMYMYFVSKGKGPPIEQEKQIYRRVGIFLKGLSEAQTQNKGVFEKPLIISCFLEVETSPAGGFLTVRWYDELVAKQGGNDWFLDMIRIGDKATEKSFRIRDVLEPKQIILFESGRWQASVRVSKIGLQEDILVSSYLVRIRNGENRMTDTVGVLRYEDPPWRK